MGVRWRFGIIAAVFLAVFCLYPQMKMLYLRGDAWNGHYAYNDIDEVAYASYVRALIDGRPRRNDPYSGRDDTRDAPQPESLFSIQFAAPYSIALPARILGIGTPWAITLSGALAGFLAAIAGFWLVARMTGSSWFGMAASLAIFAGGALAAGEGALPEILYDGFSYPYFPGFRRYIPAMAIAAVFGFFGVVWRIVSAGEKSDGRTSGGSGILWTAIAILLFAYTVFSYFYVWTTAAAFLAVLAVLWTAIRPEAWRVGTKRLLMVGAGSVAALVPYAYLLSNRGETMDQVQLLVYSRAPDFARVPVYISLACLLLLAVGGLMKVVNLRERAAIYTLALAITPIVIFNQQVITGRSLQPIHYQVFIGNYVAALALMCTIGLLARGVLVENRLAARAACVVLSLAAVFWGFVECHYTVRVLDDANIERDLALPAARKLEEMARSEADPHRATVLAFDMIQADDLPTVAPQNVLWARHQHVFAGLSWQESKERYYQFLYYSNVDENGLDYLLKNDFVSQIALFGWGRHTDRLSSDAKPLTYGEVADEVNAYAEYRDSFDRKRAAAPLLSYVVVNDEARTDLSVVDRWYERYDPQTVGKYTIYRVRLR
jgi:hypothetical protein